MTGKPGDREQLLAWAAAGSRISGFHHDSASKLQSLMMALDEASELAAEQPQIARPIETAMTALKALHALLTENRALAKAPVRKPVEVKQLLERAAARVAVTLDGALPARKVNVAPPSIVQALALLLDTIAGPAQGKRTVAIEAGGNDATVTLTATGVAPEQPQLDAITVATWLIEREDGTVQSSPSGYQISLAAIP